MMMPTLYHPKEFFKNLRMRH